MDDLLGTDHREYASGQYQKKSKKNNKNDKKGGGTVSIHLGGVNDERIVGMSGGWVLDFDVPRTGRRYELSVRFRLQSSGKEGRLQQEEGGQAATGGVLQCRHRPSAKRSCSSEDCVRDDRER